MDDYIIFRFDKWHTTNGDVGAHEVTVKVTDSAGASDERTFTLTVNNVNDAPSLEEIPDASINEEAAGIN